MLRTVISQPVNQSRYRFHSSATPTVSKPSIRVLHRSWIHSLQREKLEVVVLVEPRAFERFERQPEPSAERQRVDRQLHMRVFFLKRLRLVVQDVQVPVSDL